jgi:hypothetical protein
MELERCLDQYGHVVLGILRVLWPQSFASDLVVYNLLQQHEERSCNTQKNGSIFVLETFFDISLQYVRTSEMGNLQKTKPLAIQSHGYI